MLLPVAVGAGSDEPFRVLALLSRWRWQAVHVAHPDRATWAQIAAATGTTAERAEAGCREVIERYSIAGASNYQEVP